SKSTVHKDMTQRLMRVNKSLYNEVRAVLNDNKEQRHLRGGEATKRKYHMLCE
ncbi:MAG: sporulation transcriptional regulator SpoIIID, partial [Oscillospiraceae bacterium]